MWIRTEEEEGLQSTESQPGVVEAERRQEERGQTLEYIQSSPSSQAHARAEFAVCVSG